MEDDKIREGLSFKSTEINVNLNTYKKCIEHYYENFTNSIELKNEIPVFLDTNILLRYYSISFKQRELMKKFFIDNTKRIYLSGQVQKEFIKNREDVIQRYFHSALESMITNLKSEVIDNTIKFQNDHKEILKDFDYVDKSIVKQVKAFEKVHNDLKKDIQTLKTENKQLNFLDEFLEIISQFNQDFSLDSAEQEYLKKEFDILKKDIDPQKVKNEIKKINFAFPGLGDIIEKPDNPYGDYFIYHEMVKCALKNDTDIIFLTYDTTKGDWMRINKDPHIHYLIKTYEISNKSIFILDADRFFEKHLSTNFESLIGKDKDFYSIESIIEQDIILEFVKLERIIRTIAEFVCVERADLKPLSVIIRNLHEKEIIEDENYHQLREITMIKNHLTHKKKDYIKERYTEELLNKIYNYIENNIDYLNQIYSIL